MWVVGYLAAAGIYCHCHEDDMAYGTDASDSRNERMILKVVGHLGDSDHKYNPMALSQLAAAWPASRTVSIELDEIGAYSYNEGGQLIAKNDSNAKKTILLNELNEGVTKPKYIQNGVS